MPRLRHAATLAALVTTLIGVGPAAAANGQFQVTYVGGQITVNANGIPVGVSTGPEAVIPPGVYDVVVVDTTGQLYFELSGPGVDLIAAKSPTTGTVTFAPGATYFYQDLHEMGATARTFLTSGAAPTATTTRPTGPGVSSPSIIGSAIPGPPLGTLRASRTPRGSLSLTEGGKPVTTLTPGRYTFVVADTSTTAGFTLSRSGTRAVTVSSPHFVGRRTVTLNLPAGRWTLTGLGATKSFLVAKG